MSANSDQTKGRIKQAVGDLTDDDDLRREGQVDEKTGKAKEAVQRGKEHLDDAIDQARDKITGN